jgi:hypothetical protein
MATPQRAAVPAPTLARLRSICLTLPEAREEAAWVGTRWKVGDKTFAHVLAVAEGWPPAYARVVGTDGPVCVLTFRSPLPALDAYAYTWPPFFRPGWWPNLVGMRLDPDDDSRIDWDEIEGLVTESYRVLAPEKWVRRIGEPGA